MNRKHIVAIVVSSFIAGTFALNCSSPLKQLVPAVVKLGAQDCVEIAKMEGNTKVEQVCATAEELTPLLDAILAARKKSLPDAGIDAQKD